MNEGNEFRFDLWLYNQIVVFAAVMVKPMVDAV